MEFKLITEKELLKKYDYKTAKIKGFKTLGQMNLPSGYFGGRIHRIAELKDKEIYLLLDNLSNVIGLLEPLKKEAKKVEPKVDEVVTNVCEEGSECAVTVEIIKCEKCGKEFKNNFGLQTHQRFCK